MYIIENLSKVYTSQHGTVRALDNVSVVIQKGSFVTVTGSSGSGKTTLLLSLGGLIRPTEGTITFQGRALYGLSEPDLADYRNRRVGFVLQTFNLIPYLTAIENVMLPMLFSPDRDGPAQLCAEELLQKVGLSDRSEHLPREMSVGQQQRVAIARALANSPDVILADEPTGNLDPGLSLEILRLLKDLHVAENRTVIMVTHSPQAAEFGDRQLRLRDGRLEN